MKRIFTYAGMRKATKIEKTMTGKRQKFYENDQRLANNRRTAKTQISIV